jgi:type III secretion protein U
MAGESEEKDLPASQRKLRQAREKGQTASSTDFVNALALIAGVAVILSSWPRYLDVFTSSLRLALDAASRPARGESLKVVVDVFQLIGQVVLPLFAAVAAAGFLAHLIHKKGLILSTDPIMPDFNRLNPATGFGRMFSMRNFIEFFLALLRCFFWFAVAGAMVWFATPQILMSSSCDIPCVSSTGVDLIKRLLIVALILLIVFGLLDLPFQIFMFSRDQKMSRSEMKQESKEQQGSPEFVGFRREQHRELLSGSGKGLRGASLIIVSSGEAVAVYYDPNAQPVPVVVARGRGIHADPILKTAQASGIPIEVDPRLATELFKVGIGSMVPEREFSTVAKALFKHGKIG